MPTVLIVDDEPNVLYSLQQGLESPVLTVHTAQTGRQAVELVSRERPDAVVLDVRLPDMSGLAAFDQIRSLDARLPIIVITAFATTDTAIEAMKRGAMEYLLKPVDLYELRNAVQQAVELSRLRNVPALFGDDRVTAGADHIVGQSPAMQDVYKAIGRVAPQHVSVLILGESGTGKELVARAIYHHSQRSQAPFLALNCAAIPENLLESELFGHERGAFTGAEHLRIGKFEQSHGGTVFLDELGDMSLATQAKLLRVLQDGTFERVGSTNTIQVDVRIIAATNQDLEAMVKGGRFRADLFFRLNDFTIRMPPLRERPEDIPPLFEHFLRTYNQKLSKQVESVAPEAMQWLTAHSWPGNVRELQGVIKFALIHAAGNVLTADCLPPSVKTTAVANGGKSETFLDVGKLVRDMIRAGEPEIYEKVVAEVDRIVLTEALNHLHGSQVQASELLGISRTTLRTKLASLGLAVAKQVQPESGQSD